MKNIQLLREKYDLIHERDMMLMSYKGKDAQELWEFQKEIQKRLEEIEKKIKEKNYV